MGKVNEYQSAWADSVGLTLLDKETVEIRLTEGNVLLGRGASVFASVVDAYINRRRVAETHQSALGVLLGLGKDPDMVLDAIDQVFPPEDEEGDDEEDADDDDSVEVEER